ncbi:MAG: TlpA disulfide reductase family protein [Pseudomonadota bacterium]
MDGSDAKGADAGRRGTSLRTLIITAAVAAGVGFGAVYLLAPSTSRKATTTTAEAPTSGASAPARVRTAPTSVDGQTEQRAAAGSGAPAPTATDGVLPTTAGKNPLSVGEMAMFVFRAPQALPEVAFNGPDGTPMSFDAWSGRVVLVNLWATWCAPCRKEMPDLSALQKELGGDDFEVVAISLDRGAPEKPQAFLNEVGATALKIYHDPTARLGTRLNAIGLPATLLLDRQGREIGRLIGPADWDSADAKRLVKTAIAATAKSVD